MSDTCPKAAFQFPLLSNRYRFPELVSVLCFYIVLVLAAFPAAAQDTKYYVYDGAFADAVFEVESAIVDRGLVVDYVSHVGEMLNRTKVDVGGSKTIFENADIFLFCSAVLSREVMEADPGNIVHCPHKIIVTESGDGSGTVQVGYPLMPDGPMKKVEALLDKIARSVTGN